MNDARDLLHLKIKPKLRINETDFMFDHNVAPEEQAIIKARWGPGPWQDEPDRLEWWYQGMPCLILRGGLGQLNGYVGVPVGHPWYENTEPDAEAPGGITWADKDDKTISWHGPNGPLDERWWVGFDCGHAWDRQPALDAELQAITGSGNTRMSSQVYRDLNYVREHVEDLAMQAASETPGEDPF